MPLSRRATPMRSRRGWPPRSASCWRAGWSRRHEDESGRSKGAPLAGVRLAARREETLATRARVLNAARDLFDEVGYEETTIRMVAERAGVAVGSVFTTFAGQA